MTDCSHLGCRRFTYWSQRASSQEKREEERKELEDVQERLEQLSKLILVSKVMEKAAKVNRRFESIARRGCVLKFFCLLCADGRGR
jgi:ribosomal protein L9